MMSRRALMSLSLFGLILFASSSATAQDVRIPSVLVTLIDDVNVSATESGVLTEIGVKVGSSVKPKQLLARIDDLKAGLTLQQKKTEVAIAAEKAKNDVKVRFAKKTQAVAKAELGRALESVKIFKPSVSNSELDALRLTVDRATLDIEQTEADLQIAKLLMQAKQAERDLAAADVSHRRLLSPITGMVVDVRKKQCEWVEPGDKIFRVIRLDRLRVVAFVKFQQIRGALKGRSVVLTVDLPGAPRSRFSGKVTYVSPEVDRNSQDVAVWVEIQNPDHKLKPGLRGDLVIQTLRR